MSVSHRDTECLVPFILTSTARLRGYSQLTECLLPKCHISPGKPPSCIPNIESSNYDPHSLLLPEKTEPQVHAWADSHHLTTKIARVHPEPKELSFSGCFFPPAPLTQPGQLGIGRCWQKPISTPGQCVLFLPAPVGDFPQFTSSIIQWVFVTRNTYKAECPPSKRLHFRETKS